jgi:hypothetical protein
MPLLTELATYLWTRLNWADWCTKREIIGAIVQRIEIGPTNLAIVLRLPTEISVRGVEPIVVTYEGLASRKGSATADRLLHWSVAVRATSRPGGASVRKSSPDMPEWRGDSWIRSI